MKITELAQSLKAAAENAIGPHERLAAYPYGEIIDISQHEGEQIDIDITDINEFHEEANPVNILALLEALEKAQGMEAYWETQCRGITDHCEELQARIAELESRTVKLPLPSCTYADHSYPAYTKQQVLTMLESLGVTVVEEDV